MLGLRFGPSSDFFLPCGPNPIPSGPMPKDIRFILVEMALRAIVASQGF